MSFNHQVSTSTFSTMNGMEGMKNWSMYTPIFSGKLFYNYRCNVKCSFPVFTNCDNIFSQRLFPLKEPGMNSEASPLTKEEVEVQLLNAAKLTFQKRCFTYSNRSSAFASGFSSKQHCKGKSVEVLPAHVGLLWYRVVR